MTASAGQAAPQVAAGAIWRSRRVVIVGDPLQLEPVVTIPLTAQQALRRHHGVAETWLPELASVQTLADRVTPIGTRLPGNPEPVWVGSPLRVHRRCDNPMFHISNRIAYDDMMVHATGDRPPLHLPDSGWIDIAGTEAHGHWIPHEGRATSQLLQQLADAGIEPDNLFMICPFRDVARGLGRLVARQSRSLPARVRTIHTVQGQEADVVILVLGGNPARPGAKAWAAERPNLLNVAVSRARRRMYVIGDRQAWTQHRYFDTLGNNLPVITDGR